MVKIKSNYLFKSLFPREDHTKTGHEKILTLIICFSIFLTEKIFMIVIILS